MRGLLLTLLLVLPVTAAGQNRLDASRLSIDGLQSCSALGGLLSGNESGGNWLIGDGIRLYGQSNSPVEFTRLDGQFEKVTCFAGVDAAGGLDRVFVANDDRSVCGWVDRRDLLSTNAFADRESGRLDLAACEVPRAMRFAEFCRLTESANVPIIDCSGVPRGLRAKGVLMGSTADSLIAEFSFMTAPEGGEERESRLFFSVLEIHDIALRSDDAPVVLVGDGEGEMFGWIELKALALWPTRLGLFYDEDGRGAMFQREGDMISHFAFDPPAQPDILPGDDPAAIYDFVHGRLPLLSYPIIRLDGPEIDPNINPRVPGFLEVIFLGQTGDGSASQLMTEAELAREIESLQRLNIMFVLDTTESMREYMPFVQEGIAQFVGNYRALSRDASNRLPNVRIGAYAYSDFRDAGRIGLGNEIRLEELMPPTRIDEGSAVERPLSGITRHAGLDDEVGLREEAAVEAVYQLSRQFAANRAWFEDGPRVIIHVADHGSRANADVAAVDAFLREQGVYYFPIVVLTNDEGDQNRTRSRRLFEQQAATLFERVVAGGDVADQITQIDLVDPGQRTPEAVSDTLTGLTYEIVSAVNLLRGNLLGDTLARDSDLARDGLASQIIIDEVLLRERGLDPDQIGVIVQASTGFAPGILNRGGRAERIDWTFTVALEPSQATELRERFDQMCRSVGRPEQGGNFRRLVIGLAESFSGDSIENSEDIRAILSDLSQMPGAQRSLLAQPPRTLLERADSSDSVVVDQLRQDVCWTSYHLNNMGSELYARADQVQWFGSEFGLKPGEEVTARTYVYKPVVGAETVYLPSFFFVLPEYATAVEEDGTGGCEFFCN